MPRQWDVFPGRAVSKDEQVTINDTALGGDLSTDTTTVDQVAGPTTVNLTLADTIDVNSPVSADEKNLFSATVTDSIQLIETRSAVKTGTSPGRQVIYGSSLGPKTWNQIDTMLGGIPALRNYSPGNGDLAKFNSNADLQSALNSGSCRFFYITHKGSTVDSVSGKTRWSASDLDNWWNQAAFPSESSGIEVAVGYWHEPIDDWTSTALQDRYRILQQQFCDYIHANGPSNVKATGPCWQTAEMYKTGTARFNLWYPGNDPQGVPYYDYNSADIYSRVSRASDTNVVVGGQTQWAGYQYYKELFIDKRHPSTPGDLGWEEYMSNHPSRSGMWLIGEFASGIAGVDTKASAGYAGPLDNSPRNGFKRAQWLADCVDNFDARSDKVKAIFYWNSDGNLGTYFLDSFGDIDSPPIWAAACADTRNFYGWH